MVESTSWGKFDTRNAVIRIALALVLVTVLAVAPAAAGSDDTGAELQSQMQTVGQFLAIVITAVAIPNGAFGVFQWMTAGTDTEQSDKGRKRIRNSFVGVAGAGAVMVAVELLTGMLGTVGA